MRRTKPDSGLRGRLVASSCALALVLAGTAHADPPLIDHQAVGCSLAAKNPRICATIADDGTVKRAKIYFRAAGQAAFYWTEMELDFRKFCATLPVPESDILKIEYYLWAIDNDLEAERTIDHAMSVDPSTSCDLPVIDEDAARISSLVVHATSPKQGKKLKDFVADGVTFHRIKKR